MAASTLGAHSNFVNDSVFDFTTTLEEYWIYLCSIVIIKYPLPSVHFAPGAAQSKTDTFEYLMFELVGVSEPVVL
jgi:hypothetical protein